MVFNTTALSNVNNLVDLVRFADDATAQPTHIFGFAILMLVFFVVFGITIKFGSDKALGYSAFVGFILSLFLYFTDFIAKGVVVFMILLIVFSIFWLTGKRRDEEGNI